jgi:hypothetical protein
MNPFRSAATELKRATSIDFAEINRAALASLPNLLSRWLPDGKRRGQEYHARNPNRADRRLGSFAINLRTGKWSDFATGDRGGDVVSLAAYLFDLSQGEAARRLAEMLGVKETR